MFNKLVETMKSLAPPEYAFDPSVFNDPVALETEWGPAKSGGTNFRTHHLVEVDGLRLVFLPHFAGPGRRQPVPPEFSLHPGGHGMSVDSTACRAMDIRPPLIPWNHARMAWAKVHRQEAASTWAA